MKFNRLMPVVGALALTTMLTGCDLLNKWFCSSKDACCETKKEETTATAEETTVAKEVEKAEAIENNEAVAQEEASSDLK